MKKLVFLAIAVISLSVSAVEENGYAEKLKKETNRVISEIKSISKDLCSLVSSKKNEAKKLEVLAYNSSRQLEPVILESCDHCKDLCMKDQSTEFFA